MSGDKFINDRVVSLAETLQTDELNRQRASHPFNLKAPPFGGRFDRSP